MVPANIKPDVLNSLVPFTDWIGFNLFDIRKSKMYATIQGKGIRSTYNINDKTRIFISSTAEDEQLVKYYNQPNAIERLKKDIVNFGVDLVMGPDWFVYEDQPLSVRRKNLAKAISLNQQCVDVENIAPNIHGTNLAEATSFIEPFKKQGKQLYVMAGRGRLINFGERKKSQRNFAFLTSAINSNEKVKLIVTGCSSPKLQEMLTAVTGFASLGWLIQSRLRRLIMHKTYRSIFDRMFVCKDYDCCAMVPKKELAQSIHDKRRAIHNLKKITAGLANQPTLGYYNW
jgi:hypothetical protein